MNIFFIYYIILINLFSFLLTGIDKYRAIKNKWRIKEKTLFFLASIGGALGVIFAMELFRHKTQKKIFKYGIPALIIINIFSFIILRKI